VCLLFVQGLLGPLQCLLCSFCCSLPLPAFRGDVGAHGCVPHFIIVHCCHVVGHGSTCLDITGSQIHVCVIVAPMGATWPGAIQVCCIFVAGLASL
jgi:hypothetical protein